MMMMMVMMMVLLLTLCLCVCVCFFFQGRHSATGHADPQACRTLRPCCIGPVSRSDAITITHNHHNDKHHHTRKSCGS
jgi:hypothetical protein